MKTPCKAYLVHETHTGFGLMISPIIVLAYKPGDTFAHISHLNVTRDGAYVPTLGARMTAPVIDLAGSRLKALAKIALRLRSVDETMARAVPSPPANKTPVSEPETVNRAALQKSDLEPAMAGGPRRREILPWWRKD